MIIIITAINHYVIAWGAIAVGAVRFFEGVSMFPSLQPQEGYSKSYEERMRSKARVKTAILPIILIAVAILLATYFMIFE